ncbi:serine/threonine protein kinase [Streptomyces celluloflavus]|uniref:non-specific serine/threonine protein kinase n=1 Tax=Streptomyces celluloflavus TaxID=58344 RepID=A0ABW7RKR4_9ACTN
MNIPKDTVTASDFLNTPSGGDQESATFIPLISVVTALRRTARREGRTMYRHGKLVLERYELLDQIGSGGQGELYRGRDTETGRHVAVKLQKARLFEPENSYRGMGDTFEEEAAMTQQLTGIRGVPRVIASGPVGFTYERRCIVLEFVEGPVLYDAMLRGRPLRTPTVASIIGQLCEILHRVHDRQLVHRDIKPENVILDPSGCVWLIDMGLALHQGEKTDRGDGTPGYVPPDEYDGCPDGVTLLSDIFALGCMLLEMTVMQLPYAGMAERPAPDCPVLPPDRMRRVPLQFRSLALSMVDRVPGNRPQGVREVFDQLRPLLPILGSKPPAKPLRPDPTEYYRTRRPTL